MYIAIVTDTGGCVQTDTIYVIAPNSAISLSAISLDEINGNDGSINLTVSGGTPPYSFNWDNGAGTNEDPTGLTGNMTYTVVVSDSFGCTDTLSVFVASQVGIAGINPLNASFFPNPAKETISIVIPNSGPHTIRIVDLTGKTINTNIINPVNNHPSEIGITQLAPGSYILEIDNGKTMSRFMMVKN